MVLADRKKEKEYQWLQEQLTRDVHQLEGQGPGDRGGTTDNNLMDNGESEEDCQEAMNHAYIREMKELQQALSSEVSEHIRKKKKTSVQTDENDHSEYSDVDNYDVLSSKHISNYHSDSISEKDSKQLKEEKKQNSDKRDRLPIWVGVLISGAFVALSVGIVICAKNIGKTALSTVGLIDEEKEEVVEEIEITTIPEVTATIAPVVTPEVTIPVEEEPEEVLDEVYNVVLLGIDTLAEEKNADTIVVASMNITDKTYHIIQFMRDLYVDIPGYGKEVLSEAYRYGGGALVTQTISDNFAINIEGYISVDFESFPKIIDSMGGINITLTKEEAEYLNTTNYISIKANRTMIEGKQTVNGDQALGYCRIQEVPNKDDLEYDFGRVTRAKAVLNQLFQKASGMSLGDMLYSMNEVLPYLRTNLTKEKFRSMLETMSEIGMSQLDSLRVPIYQYYSRETLNNHTIYVPEVEETTKKIETLIYGEETTD